MLPIERFIKFLYINDKLFRAHSGFILEAFDSTRSFSPLLLTGARPIKQILQNFSAVSCSTFKGVILAGSCGKKTHKYPLPQILRGLLENVYEPNLPMFQVYVTLHHQS